MRSGWWLVTKLKQLVMSGGRWAIISDKTRYEWQLWPLTRQKKRVTGGG